MKDSELRIIAYQTRIMGLEMAKNAGSGHLGGAFSLSEILSVLYFSKMNIDPRNPRWDARDRLVVSKGHATVALYPMLARRGFMDVERLLGFRSINSHLSGHVEMQHVPGVDMSTGSLGQGLSAAVGMATYAKLFNKAYYTYAICGDGELQEGQIWEAAAFAANKKLNQLILFVDNNRMQLDGPTCEISDLGDIGNKFEAFGWNVIRSIDGHDVGAISSAIDAAKASQDRPTVIVANTVKGKGVSFMEDNYLYHGKHPDSEHYEIAFAELRETLKSLGGKEWKQQE